MNTQCVGGGGLKKWQNSVHVVVECPPSRLRCLERRILYLLKTGSDKIIYWLGRCSFLLFFIMSKKKFVIIYCTGVIITFFFSIFNPFFTVVYHQKLGPTIRGLYEKFQIKSRLIMVHVRCCITKGSVPSLPRLFWHDKPKRKDYLLNQ